MSEILIKNIVKDVDKKNYNYKVDREGNLIREKYSLFKDPYTLVTITLIFAGLVYYLYAIENNPLAVKNIDSTCSDLGEICGRYLPLKYDWIVKNPNKTLDVREIIGTVVEINKSNACPYPITK